MSEVKKSGKTVLRSIDGSKAAGLCLYSIGHAGIEATISAQLPEGPAEAVFQSGPDGSYACRAPVSLSGTILCKDPNAAAVWVLAGGTPALFGQIRAGAFDTAEARRKLQDALLLRPAAKQAQQAVSAAALPASPANPMVRPANREPSSADQAVPFPSPKSPVRAVYPPRSGEHPLGPQAAAKDAILLLQPGPQPPQKSAEPQPAQAVRAASLPQTSPQASTQQAPPAQPLVVRRAPRPTPRPPVYSPLWDDVSAEFEKMLDTLPQAHPFSGDSSEAKIAEMPTGGAVQCYVGSVDVDGMKVFLQAVPARPYARPAGFDHSLVSRSGECFWVKYIIQNE